MDICFRNNAANTNTQQSPPLANSWLKQIKVNYIKQRDPHLPFLQTTRTHSYEETTNTLYLKRYLRYSSSSHHEHIFKKKEWQYSITKEISEVCTKEYPTQSSVIASTKEVL